MITFHSRSWCSPCQVLLPKVRGRQKLSDAACNRECADRYLPGQRPLREAVGSKFAAAYPSIRSREAELSPGSCSQVFCGKVLAVLFHGSCMYGLQDNLVEFLSGIQDSCARQMFLPENWRNAAVAAAKLGWKLPLHLEMVTEVAMRRYRPRADSCRAMLSRSHGLRRVCS